jgi:hypothetical protein
MKFDLNTLSTSKSFRGFLLGIGSFILVAVVFQTGVFVGFRKASFAFRYGDNYYQNFGGPDRGPMSGAMGLRPFGRDLPGGHGATGKIVRVSLPTLLVAGPDNLEKVVRIGEDTKIRRFREEIKATDLRVDDTVVIIGAPNETAEVAAKLIRVMPPAGVTAPKK